MKFYIGFACALFIIGAVSGIYEIYHLAYFSLGVGGAVVFFTQKAVEDFEMERVVENERIFHGEKSEVKLSLINDSMWPVFWLSYSEKVPIKLRPPLQAEVISLLPGERREINYTLKGQRRGYYTLGPLSIRIGDGLGFVEEIIKFAGKQEFIVYPQIHPLEDLGLPSRIIFGDVIWPQKIYRDPTEFRSLREYSRGDQLKDIHWKSTASTGQLMVKEYESTVAISNMIFLNLHRDDYEVKTAGKQIELAIEAAASIAHYLIEKRQLVGLATNGEDPIRGQQKIKPGEDMSKLLEIMELLARIEMTKENSFLAALEEYGHQLAPGSTVLIITKLDTEELLEEVLKLCRKGLNVVIIVMGSQIVHSQYLNRSYTENLVIYKLNQEEDIYGWGD